jgi:hypothetical protein
MLTKYLNFLIILRDIQLFWCIADVNDTVKKFASPVSITLVKQTALPASLTW